MSATKLYDNLPVAIYADAPPANLYDLLHQAYGAAADNIKNIKVGYYDANALNFWDFNYWDWTDPNESSHRGDLTRVLYKGADVERGGSGHSILEPKFFTIPNSDFKNVTFDIGNNIFSNIYIQVDIRTDPLHPVYQDLDISVVPHGIGSPSAPHGAPTAADIVAMADQIDLAYGGGKVINLTDCWNIARDVAAAAGAPLELNSYFTDPTQNEQGGFWRIAYRGTDSDAVNDWQTKVQPGDIVRIAWQPGVNGGGPHSFTVVDGPDAQGYIEVLDNMGIAAGYTANDGMPSAIGEHWVKYDDITNPASVTIYRLSPDHMYLINGSAQSETLYGTVYNDRMVGGAGDDTYYVNNPSDQVVEHALGYRDGNLVFGGNDTIIASVNYALPNFVENLTLAEVKSAYEAEGNDLSNVLTGNSGANYIQGHGGGDQLNGKDGYDTLIGGDGDDQYFLADFSTVPGTVEHRYDQVIEEAGGGIDTVNVGAATYQFFGGTFTTTSYALPDNVENAVIVGDKPFYVVGNNLENVINGNPFNNIIDGRGGADTMAGGAGDDTYYVDDLGDRVIEHQVERLPHRSAPGGTDTIISSVDYRPLPDFVENLTLREGSSAHAAFGNALQNSIIGNSIANVINGGANDDTMTGGGGTDTFAFSRGDGKDTITDFTIGEDHLDLRSVGVTSVSQLAISHNRAGDAVITYDGGGDTITLSHVTQAQVQSKAGSIFQFALPHGQTFDGTTSWGHTVTGTAGSDTLTFATQKAGVYVDLVRDGGFSELAQIEADGSKLHGHMTGIENVTGATDYMNGLIGDDQDNILIGGDWGNWFEGRGGNNTLIGGASTDYADYAASPGGVTIDLSAGKAYHDGYIDKLVSIECFRGSYHSDTFIGSEGNDYYNDLGGHDTLFGNGGDDDLAGYAGVTIDGGAGKDTLRASYGDDLFTGGAGHDTFAFGDGSLGRHEITDFNPDEDHISFSGYTIDPNLRFGNDGHGNAMITYATRFGEATVVLDHVEPNALHTHPEWFIA